MLPYLPPHGFFVEAGANDGISQSNTWHLEAYRRWDGLLIEPIPWLYELCRGFRRVETVNCALTSLQDAGGVLELAEDDLKTRVGGGAAERIIVPAQALSNLLDERGVERVDFLSLDVEGFEAQVLSGVDLRRHRIDRLLIESGQPERVAALLGGDYDAPIQLSFHDYFFVRKDLNPS